MNRGCVPHSVILPHHSREILNIKAQSCSYGILPIKIGCSNRRMTFFAPNIAACGFFSMGCVF